MKLVYEQEELSALLVRVACLGRKTTPELVTKVSEVMLDEIEVAKRYSFAIIPRPQQGIVNVLLAPDYAHATGMPHALLSSPHIEDDVTQMGIELIGELRTHYAGITVRH